MPLDLTLLLDSADSGLNLVSESMLRADLILLEESRIVLKQLIQNLTEVKQVVSSREYSAICTDTGENDTRRRLEDLHVKLRRLQALGDVAASAIRLRSQSSGLTESGYTAQGVANLNSDLRTISMDY